MSYFPAQWELEPLKKDSQTPTIFLLPSAWHLRPSTIEPFTFLSIFNFTYSLVLAPNKSIVPQIKCGHSPMLPFLLLFLLPPRATRSCQYLFPPPRSNSKHTSGHWVTLDRDGSSLLWITALHPMLPRTVATCLRVVSPKCTNNHLEASFYHAYSP